MIPKEPELDGFLVLGQNKKVPSPYDGEEDAIRSIGGIAHQSSKLR
jgi:hypothetical protein